MFLTSEILIRPFQAEFTIFTDAWTQGWGTHIGDSQIAGVWTRLQRKSPHQCAGAQGGNIGPSSLGYSITGLSCFDRYRQYHCRQYHCCTSTNKVDPFPPPVAAGCGSVSVATDSGHYSASQTHFGLPQCDSRWVISAEPAHHNKVESPPRSRESDIQTVGNSSSGHVCHSPPHASSPVHVSSSGASITGDRCLVTGLAGEVDVHVSTVSPAQQSHSEAQDHSSTSTSPVCGPPMLLSIPQRPVVTTGLYLERQVLPSASKEALMQHYQAAGFSKEVSRLAAAPRSPSTNRI